MPKQLRIRRVSQKKKKEYEGTLQLFFFSSLSSPCFCCRLVVHQNQLFHKIIVNGNMEDSNKVVKTQVSINFLLLSKSNRCSKWHSIFTSHFLATVPGAQISSRLIFLGNWQSHRFFWYKQSDKLLIKLEAILQLPTTSRSNMSN